MPMDLLKRTDDYYGGSENVVVTLIDTSLDLVYEKLDGNDKEGTSVKVTELNQNLHHYTDEDSTNSSVETVTIPIVGKSLETIYTAENGFQEHPNLQSSSTNEETELRTVTYKNGDSFSIAISGQITKL
tara:strand:+ start:14424 stop:14810 length:387 start_codon:yes stop_codon:yes gene_type:complete